MHRAILMFEIQEIRITDDILHNSSILIIYTINNIISIYNNTNSIIDRVRFLLRFNNRLFHEDKCQ